MSDIDRRIELARRQQQLLLRSAELRNRWSAQVQPWQAPLAVADRVRETGRWLASHPEAPLAGLVVLTVMRPRRVWRWGLRLWWGWRTWRQLQRRLAVLRPR